VFQGIGLIKVHEAGAVAPPLGLGVHHQGVEYHDLFRGGVLGPGGLGVLGDLLLVDLGGGHQAAVFLGHEHIPRLDGVQGGLPGGIDPPDPAHGGPSGLLFGVDVVVNGGNLLQIA